MDTLQKPSLRDVQAARARIAGVVHRTPLLSSATLGERVGARVFLKADSLQKTGSFKARGALNTVAQLRDDEKTCGVITVSAGNHAAALAWAAKAAGVPATVVMPATANPTKVAAVRGYGASVVLHGASSIEAFAEMDRLRAERGLALVHPFNDARIIAGAGTAGLEILEDLPDVDVVVVCVGGGGQIAGIATVLNALRPDATLIGVEPFGADAMYRSFAAGHAVHLDRVDTIADGLAPPFVGELNYAIARDTVHEIVRVTDAEIITAMRFLAERCKLVAEPAGAAAVAALMAGKIATKPGATIAATVSGGNVDLAMFGKLLGAE